jgi:hypothetical protein
MDLIAACDAFFNVRRAVSCAFNSNGLLPDVSSPSLHRPTIASCPCIAASEASAE